MKFTRAQLFILASVLASVILAASAGATILGLLSPKLFAVLGIVFAISGLALVIMVVGYAQDQRELAHNRQVEAMVLQEKLLDEQRALDDLAVGLDVAIFIVDEKSVVLYANERAKEMFRFTQTNQKPLVGLTLSYDLESIANLAAKTSQSQTGEVLFSYPEERVGLVKAWPQSPGNRIFLTVYEISDLRRLERVRQDFVSNVSHEMRTPLTIIRAMAETIQDAPEEDPALLTRYLGKIVSEVDRLTSLVDDLLTLSVAESNTVERYPCNLAEIWKSACLSLQPKAIDKGLLLRFAGPDSAMLPANTDQMTQVALNLIANAVNYTQKGEIDISIEKTPHEISIHVKDTGIGISSEHQSRIFERFYRVDKGRSRQTGGTGLGLSIVRHIIESHGGKVSVVSNLNQGSTFTIWLPIPGTNSDQSPSEPVLE